MKRIVINSGDRYSMLTTVRHDGMLGKEKAVLCKCDCGGSIRVRFVSLKNGQVKSCGCYRRNRLGNASTTHGMSQTRPFRIWALMLQRCRNTSNPSYPHYGGRGIKVCDKWSSFEGFWEDMSHSYDDTLTLDRCDNNGDYTKENCRWATRKQQSNNTRRNRSYHHTGKVLTIAELSKESGVPYFTLRARLNRGWNMGRAIKRIKKQ